jgi:hypothetical protein
MHGTAIEATMDVMSDLAPVVVPGRRRPFTLVVLAGLMLLKAVFVVAVVAGALVDDTVIASALRIPGLTPQIRETPGAAFLLLVVAGILVLSAIGLLAGRRAGWVVAMVTTGMFIAFDIVAFFDGTANEVWMVLNIVTVFYLNQRDEHEGTEAPSTLRAGGPAAR